MWWSGLSHPGQKEFPSKYLYDEVGSALFDVICLLPEYGLEPRGNALAPAAFRGDCGTLARARDGGGTWAAAAGRKRAGCSKRSRGGSA